MPSRCSGDRLGKLRLAMEKVCLDLSALRSAESNLELRSITETIRAKQKMYPPCAIARHGEGAAQKILDEVKCHCKMVTLNSCILLTRLSLLPQLPL